MKTKYKPPEVGAIKSAFKANEEVYIVYDDIESTLCKTCQNHTMETKVSNIHRGRIEYVYAKWNWTWANSVIEYRVKLYGRAGHYKKESVYAGIQDLFRTKNEAEEELVERRAKFKSEKVGR